MAERVRSSQRRLKVLASHLGCPSAQPTGGDACTPPFVSPYTFDNGALSLEERQQFDRNGFVVKRGLLNSEDVATFRERFRQLCSREVKCPGLLIMRDVAISQSEFVPGEKAVTKIQDFQHDDVLFGYCVHPSIVKYVKAFTGEDVMAMHTMLINKPPDPGTRSSRHPFHQDLHYFPFRPTDRIVCSWTALEHVHRRNGCLVVIPGTHTEPLMPHDYPKWEGGVNRLYHGVPEEFVKSCLDQGKELVYLEMQPGDTVFFHPLLVHGSGRNRTDGFRKAISCHYASSHCWYVDVDEKQQNIAEEVKATARQVLARRGFPNVDEIDIDYADLWRIRARLVAGTEGALS